MTAVERFRQAISLFPPQPMGEKPPDYDELVAKVLLELIERVEALEGTGV